MASSNSARRHCGRSGGRAGLHDLAQRSARTNLFGFEAIDFRVTAIAQDQPPVAVEKANARRNIIDGRFVTSRLRLEFGYRLPNIPLSGLGGGSRQSHQRGQIDLAGRVGRPRNCLSAQALLLGFSDQGKQN